MNKILHHLRLECKKTNAGQQLELLSRRVTRSLADELLCCGNQSRLFGQRGGLVGRLPGELRLGAAKVPVGSGLLVDGAAQVQALDDALGREREVLANQLGQLGLADFAGAEGIDAHADRLGNADGVGKLHFGAIGQARGHDVLGDVARHVSRRAIHLRRVFAR